MQNVPHALSFRSNRWLPLRWLLLAGCSSLVAPCRRQTATSLVSPHLQCVLREGGLSSAARRKPKDSFGRSEKLQQYQLRTLWLCSSVLSRWYSIRVMSRGNATATLKVEKKTLNLEVDRLRLDGRTSQRDPHPLPQVLRSSKCPKSVSIMVPANKQLSNSRSLTANL
jgi:hypothetical protein